MSSQSFPRPARVLTRAGFSCAFEAGRRCADPLLAVHWRADATPARLGLAVSRKVDPRAVGRNRIKRTLREAFRRHRSLLAGGDYVVVARPPARTTPSAGIAQAFENALRRCGALPPSQATGTMPRAPS